MRFLKANLFLVVTVGVTLAVSGALLALAHSASSQADASADQRAGLNRELSSLAVPPLVNKDVVDASKRSVDLERQAMQVVSERVLAQNRAGLEVFTLKIKDAQGKEKVVSAFPIDLGEYERQGLRRLFPLQYAEAVSSLRAALKPTDPPTAEEIKEQVDKLAGRGAATPGIGPEGPAMLPPSGQIPYGPSPGGRFTGGTPTTPSTSPAKIELTPEERVRNKLAIEKSRNGWLYVDERALYQALPVAAAAAQYYTNEDLWLAQVSLWVQKDVIDAINRVNQEAQNASAAAPPEGVAASTVKRLMGINIRGYLAARGGGGGSMAMGMPAPAVGPGSGIEGAQYYGVTGQQQPSPPKLTGRVTNSTYDVVHYDVTVLVRPSGLLKLYQNLLLSNGHNHTILDVKLGKPRPGVGNEASSPVASVYYYGTDGVMEATITGEMLLLADFTRGKWIEGKGEWDKALPPIMPVEFLGRLGGDPSCLRPADQNRLTNLSGTPTPPLANPMNYPR